MAQLFSYNQNLNVIKSSSSEHILKAKDSQKKKPKTKSDRQHKFDKYSELNSVSVIESYVGEKHMFSRANMSKLPSTSTRIGNKVHTFSFKAKLKSKMFERNGINKKLSLLKQPQNCEYFADSLYGADQFEHKIYHKEVGKYFRKQFQF